jgi:hypothetical protein
VYDGGEPSKSSDHGKARIFAGLSRFPVPHRCSLLSSQNAQWWAAEKPVVIRGCGVTRESACSRRSAHGAGASAPSTRPYALRPQVFVRQPAHSGRRLGLAEIAEQIDNSLQFAGGSPFIHMDSGAVHKGKLYAAHSNYDEQPMESSLSRRSTPIPRRSST